MCAIKFLFSVYILQNINVIQYYTLKRIELFGTNDRIKVDMQVEQVNSFKILLHQIVEQFHLMYVGVTLNSTRV